MPERARSLFTPLHVLHQDSGKFRPSQLLIWTVRLFQENRSRLRRRQQLLVTGLAEAGIETIPANSGLFVFANFERFLETPDEEGEFAFYLKLLKEIKINANPGVACRSTEPGWFRVCFAAASDDAIEAAVSRLKEFAERTSVRPKEKLAGS